MPHRMAIEVVALLHLNEILLSPMDHMDPHKINDPILNERANPIRELEQNGRRKKRKKCGYAI